MPKKTPYELLTLPRLADYIERKLPWRVTITPIRRTQADCDPVSVPWVLMDKFDFREPFEWCREQFGDSAILRSQSRYGRHYTAVSRLPGPRFANVGSNFYFLDQTEASAFRLTWG